MSKSSIQLLTLAICATALVVVPTVTPAKAGTRSSRHIKKHRIRPVFIGSPSVDQARPAGPVYQPGEACPGNRRAIDCKIWPPPMYEDPDRKTGSSDGG